MARRKALSLSRRCGTNLHTGQVDDKMQLAVLKYARGLSERRRRTLLIALPMMER